VKTLSATLRKPGAPIVEILQVQGAAACEVPNPGIYESPRTEINLQSACDMVIPYKLTSKTLVAADLTIARVQRYAQYKEAEEDY
jgi:hypothetical protein